MVPDSLTLCGGPHPRYRCDTQVTQCQPLLLDQLCIWHHRHQPSTLPVPYRWLTSSSLSCLIWLMSQWWHQTKYCSQMGEVLSKMGSGMQGQQWWPKIRLLQKYIPKGSINVLSYFLSRDVKRPGVNNSENKKTEPMRVGEEDSGRSLQKTHPISSHLSWY